MSWLKDNNICDICGGNGELIHYGVRDRDDVDVYKCENCDTKFLVSSKTLENDYEAGFMYSAGNKLSVLSIEERLKEFEPDDVRRYNMVCELCTNKKILDFGCGFGGFLTRIKNVAKEAVGVELSEVERSYLTGKGIDCRREIGDFEDKFDVITLFHVFEHLQEPREWLKEFRKKLNPGGKLVIEVPNANDVLLSKYTSERFADFTYWSAHLMLYTTESFENLIKQVGGYEITINTQVQRYSIGNHLYWLAKGLPGGHKVWKDLDSDDLNKAYEVKLRELKMCDTLFMVLEVKR